MNVVLCKRKCLKVNNTCVIGASMCFSLWPREMCVDMFICTQKRSLECMLEVIMFSFTMASEQHGMYSIYSLAFGPDLDTIALHTTRAQNTHTILTCLYFVKLHTHTHTHKKHTLQIREPTTLITVSQWIGLLAENRLNHIKSAATV